MVENGLNWEVRGIFNWIFSSCWWFNEESIWDFSFWLVDKDPGVLSRSTIRIIFFKIWLVIINNSGFDCCYSILFLLLGNDFSIKCRFWIWRLINLKVFYRLKFVGFLLFHQMFISIFHGVILIFFIVDFKWEWALHKTFISCCDILWGGSDDNIGIITSSKQKRAKGDWKIKTITSLPVQDIGGRWDLLWIFFWLWKFFVFQKVSNELWTLLPVIKLCEWELGWSDSCANELSLPTFILWS